VFDYLTLSALVDNQACCCRLFLSPVAVAVVDVVVAFLVFVVAPPFAPRHATQLFCVHGGLSPSVTKLDEVRRVYACAVVVIRADPVY
jgi:diadenosine tetraphosphatase ApaH/serine/threonine PP2A family protein phosphatase